MWLLIQQKGQTLIFLLQLVCAGQHVMGHQHTRVQTSQQQQQSKQGDCSSAAAVLASGGRTNQTGQHTRVTSATAAAAAAAGVTHPHQGAAGPLSGRGGRMRAGTAARTLAASTPRMYRATYGVCNQKAFGVSPVLQQDGQHTATQVTGALPAYCCSVRTLTSRR